MPAKPKLKSYLPARKAKPALKDRQGRDLIGRARVRARKRHEAKEAATPAQEPVQTQNEPRQGTKREVLIGLLRRPEGASLHELLEANPLNGKTPYATLGAWISTLGKTHKVERIGDGKGEHRRYRLAE